MTVTKLASTNSRYISLVGTDAEVLNALGANHVEANKIIAIYYNGTNITCVYKAEGVNT